MDRNYANTTVLKWVAPTVIYIVKFQFIRASAISDILAKMPNICNTANITKHNAALAIVYFGCDNLKLKVSLRLTFRVDMLLLSPHRQNEVWKGFSHITIDSRYIAVIHHNSIVGTVQQLQKKNFNQTLHSRSIPRRLPSRVSYGVFFVSHSKKNDRDISKTLCI